MTPQKTNPVLVSEFIMSSKGFPIRVQNIKDRFCFKRNAHFYPLLDDGLFCARCIYRQKGISGNAMNCSCVHSSVGRFDQSNASDPIDVISGVSGKSTKDPLHDDRQDLKVHARDRDEGLSCSNPVQSPQEGSVQRSWKAFHIRFCNDPSPHCMSLWMCYMSL